MNRLQALRALAAGGVVLALVGLALGLVIPASYNDIGCGPAWIGKEFGSAAIETSVTRGCDAATASMSTVAILVLVVGVAVLVAVLFMRVPPRES